MTQRDSRVSSLGILLATTTVSLILSACSGTEDSTATGATVSAVTSATPKAAGTGAGGDHRVRPGPAEFIERFDQNGDGKLQLSEMPERARQRIGQADANGDGVLSSEEIAEGMAKRRTERFGRADQNGDGRLTEAEVGPEWWNRMRVADGDGDGSVTQAEFDQARAQGKLGPRGGPGMGRGGAKGRMFEHLDANGDGRVEASEVPERVWAHLQVADADGDGAVSQAEADQARAQGKLGPRGPGIRGQGRGGN